MLVQLCDANDQVNIQCVKNEKPLFNLSHKHAGQKKVLLYTLRYKN